jgi:hypothetical protein
MATDTEIVEAAVAARKANVYITPEQLTEQLRQQFPDASIEQIFLALQAHFRGLWLRP